MFHPLNGSLGRLFGASLGKENYPFLFIHRRLKRKGNYKIVPCSKPPRGRPVGGGGVYRVWRYGGISPHF